MKGDFSKLDFHPSANYTGVLHQQGRALLDQDWNASSAINRFRRQLQGRDAIGSHVAAVPAELRQSFKVIQAEVNGSAIDITLEPGRVWVDGMALLVAGESSYKRAATYFTPPVQTTPTTPATGKDAVILEVWQEAFNGFQDPQSLIEPALGGVDTTERITLYHNLRLLRLAEGDECSNLADNLADNFGAKGKLTVTPADTLAISGDCPLELGGGYSGFEHYLYRIEIAPPDTSANARFKWSRFNGGLVGRGTYDSTAAEIDITANDQMINHCGLPSFYLEALQPGGNGGPWEIVFTADATLSADGKLSLTNSAGTWPGTGGADAFFRLWDGIDLIDNYLAATELENGLRLEFNAPAVDNSNYTPGDYWSFPVRTAGYEFDPPPWPTSAPPEGVHYHRVPLAILNWEDASSTTLTAPQDIFDCRHVFQPLARLDGCCAYTVGDGMQSHGDFSSIQEAINHLPDRGGEICLLPGIYPEHIVIESKHDITIRGCGPNSEIIADPATTSSPAPVISILGSQTITIADVQVTASLSQIGILIDDDAEGSESKEVKLTGLQVSAATLSGIEVRSCQGFKLTNSTVEMQDESGPWPGVFVTCVNGLIEGNTITIENFGATNAETGETIPVAAGRGGLQLGGTSDDVRVINNLIQGGIGNGITLGSLVEVNASDEGIRTIIGWVVNAYDPCDPCAPGDVYLPPLQEGDEGPTYESAGTMYDIRIERNRILDMGLNGIGVVAFFNLAKEDEFVTVEGLEILGNTIKRCLMRPLEQVPEDMVKSMGYGGIALADVEYLVAKDNVIENNGPDHLEPICGIFVLHGEGVEISRNRIINNGAKTDEPSTNAKPGRRGGINIMFAVPPVEYTRIMGNVYPRQNGMPAAKVHNNIVSQPLGQALAINALGPVSVLGNQFTSRGMILELGSPTFLAATVAILNLGLSNELYLQLFLGDPIDLINDAGGDMQITDEALFVPRAGLDDLALGSYLANGNVLFNSNQCVLDLLETGFGFSLSSIFIFSLDDVGFNGNQCDSNLFDDFLLSHAIVLSLSCRISDNRFKEGFAHALFSAVTFGIFMNTTTDNQATHCFLILGVEVSFSGGFSIDIVQSGPGIVGQKNITFWDILGATGLLGDLDFCELLSNLRLENVFLPMMLGQSYKMISFNQ